ncbi:MAG: hypothetical protein JWO33_1505 [Caulobacteraceae bacterium]|nr:hypothetical protein [Caulobacteraceae bacterium]
MTGRVLLYGATGYTGGLLAERLKADGYDLVLAGRNEARLAPLAHGLDLPFRAVDLQDDRRLDGSLADIAVVLHAAGPFVETASPMMRACIRAGAHYLDLSGEWPAFVEAMDLSVAASDAGIMIMPGVGFTVVATDCLLALSAAQAPDAVKLRLGISRPGVVTRGTVRSSAGMVSPTALVRRGGALVAAPAGRLTHDFDFGAGQASATVVSWPDIVTGQFTTGVADIEIYSEADGATRLAYQAYAKASPWVPPRVWEAMSNALSLTWPEAPSAEARRNAGFVLVAEAVDRWRRSTRLRLRTLDGYTVSVLTAGEIVRRVLNGDWKPGFRTPGGLFGGEFILGLGCAALVPP